VGCSRTAEVSPRGPSELGIDDVVIQLLLSNARHGPELATTLHVSRLPFTITHTRRSNSGASVHPLCAPIIPVVALASITHHAQIQPAMAGCSAPRLTGEQPHRRIARLVALPPRTMYGFHRVAKPPPSPIATGRAARIPQLFHIAEQTEGEGPQGATRAAGRGY
jgi:hypothetical protein